MIYCFVGETLKSRKCMWQMRESRLGKMNGAQKKKDPFFNPNLSHRTLLGFRMKEMLERFLYTCDKVFGFMII